MTPKETALTLMGVALEAAVPCLTVKRNLRIRGNPMVVSGERFPVRRKVYLLTFGKATCSMARAIVDLLGERIEEGVIVTKYGYAGNCPRTERLKVIEAGHPVPDGNSLLSGRLDLELAEKVGENDILIVLISGGGSALFLLPGKGITLEDKIRTNELLLESGAKIYEITTVRKHISAVKGGKLAKRVKGTVISLILSDVVGDPLEAIASGPTVKDPTTFEDAYRILRLYNIWEKLPESVKRHIELGLKGKVEETLKEDLPNVHNFIVGSNTLACESAMKKAKELGYNALLLTTTLEGEAREIALAIGSIIPEVVKYDRPVPKPAVMIAGGEWTVTIGGKAGLGGPGIPWSRKKTLIGSVTMFAVSILALFGAHRVPAVEPSWELILGAALVATLLESLPINSAYDEFTVPFAMALLLWLLRGGVADYLLAEVML